jgi:RNA polymerase sigma-70 factor (ECF subfamily)
MGPWPLIVQRHRSSGGIGLSNRDLAARIRQREPDALDELLRLHGGELHAVAFLILRNEHDAEEVVADTLLAAWRKIETLRDPDRLRPWLLAIAARVALRQRRRFRPHVISLDAASMLPGETPSFAAELDFRDAINRLPPRMRAAIALHAVADLPVAEVAHALGTSENTVKSQLREARARLRVTLAVAPARTERTEPEANHG